MYCHPGTLQKNMVRIHRALCDHIDVGRAHISMIYRCTAVNFPLAGAFFLLFFDEDAAQTPPCGPRMDQDSMALQKKNGVLERLSLKHGDSGHLLGLWIEKSTMLVSG